MGNIRYFSIQAVVGYRAVYINRARVLRVGFSYRDMDMSLKDVERLELYYLRLRCGNLYVVQWSWH